MEKVKAKERLRRTPKTLLMNHRCLKCPNIAHWMCSLVVVDFLKDSTRLVNAASHPQIHYTTKHFCSSQTSIHFFKMQASLRLCGPSRCGSLQHRHSGSTTLVQPCSPRTATSYWSWSCLEKRPILLVRSCLRRVTWRCFAEGRPAKASVGWTASTLAHILPLRTLLWCLTSGVWSNVGMYSVLCFSWFMLFWGFFPVLQLLRLLQTKVLPAWEREELCLI